MAMQVRSKNFHKGLFSLLGVIALLVSFSFGYSAFMARMGSGQLPNLRPVAEQADRIIVSKADRWMYLLRNGSILRDYPVAMGAAWDQGHKQREGDKKTPEGSYVIEWRNPNSAFHLSLRVSYPSQADRQAAELAGVSPGGDIMIHGLPNGWGALAPLHRLLNWTDGCIAVTNAEIREIWSIVPNGTPIDILPAWPP